MQLLIVDDEQYAIEGVLHGIDWASLGITQVHCAHSIKEARDTITANEIQILLCDIEMPNGSGLDLLEWLKDHSSHIVTILLTCHSEFIYSQRAIKLGCFDYVLKPVPYDELSRAIARAVNKYKEDRRNRQNVEMAELFRRHRGWLYEQFWQQVLHGALPAGEIADCAAVFGVLLQPEDRCLPVIARIVPHKNAASIDANLLLFSAKNIALENIVFSHGWVVGSSIEHIAIIKPVAEGSDLEAVMAEMEESCERFDKACQAHLGCSVSCCIGRPATLAQLPMVYLELISHMQLRQDGSIHRLTVDPMPSSDRQLDPAVLQHLLDSGDDAGYRAEVQRLLDQGGSPAWLSRCMQAVIETITYRLLSNGVPLARVQDFDNAGAVFANAAGSQEAFLCWLDQLMTHYAKLMRSTEKVSLIEQVKTIILSRMNEGISVTELAACVHLSADHLNRLFKKQTGMTLLEFIVEQRMSMAKKLLSASDQSVGNIALQLGYSSFSYFSKVFRKVTGVSPVEYRQQYRKE